jgi:NADH dehydrogenase
MSTTEAAPAAHLDGTPTDRVVILGSGYAGLRVAQQLERYAHEPGAPEVLLVDRHPYHQIITDLPQAASGRAEADTISLPIAHLLKRSRVRFLQAEVSHIDLQQQLVSTSEGALAYGTLVIALGSITAFYEVPGLAEHSLTLKSVDDAQEIEARVRHAIALAATETDQLARAGLLSILIGGGGLTGVELAGELAEILPLLAVEYGLDPHLPHITLVEGAPVLLPSMPARLQAAAARALTGMGVRLMLGTKVASADGEGVWLDSGDRLVGRTLAWTGGIMAPPIIAESGLPTGRNGQVSVDRYLRAIGHPEVYVVGDTALINDDAHARPLAPTAQAAVKQGEAAAYNIVAGWQGWASRPYTPHDEGQVVSLGPQDGVASIIPGPLTGGRAISLTGRKVSMLKAVIVEAYRISATGHFVSLRPSARRGAP